MPTTYKLIQGDSILVAQPLLIQQYGRVGASLIQQIYYWSQKGQGIVHDNQRWIHNTAEQWAVQLCVSARTIKRTVQKLIQDGAIRVQKLSRHKSNQTNSYTLNHERLKELMGSCIDESTHESEVVIKNSGKAHRDILSQPTGHDVPMVIQKITYKNKHNKSEGFAYPYSHKTERDESSEAQSCMTSPQVATPDVTSSRVTSSENIIPQVGEEVKEDHRSLPPRLAQSMMDVWNNEVSTKKNINKIKLTRDISKYLVASYKYRFNEDLNTWKHYCSLIASSSYLMSEAFSLSLSWALKFGTIDRILAGELGVKKIERVRTEEELRTEALRHIDGVGEGEGCKQARLLILKAVGAAQYNAWFTKVDLADDGATLKPHNTFVEAAIQARFGHVLERVG